MSARRAVAGVAVVALAWLTAGCTGGESAEKPSGADTVARVVAAALSSGDLSDVELAGTEPGEAQQWWDDATEAMGDTPLAVEVDGVTESSGGTATATLSYTWDIGAKDWSYRSTAQLRQAAGRWVITQDPALVAPALREGETLDLGRLPAARGKILGAGGATLVTDRPVMRFGIDKTLVSASKAAASARDLARLLDVDAGALAERVRDAGADAFVEALVLRIDDVPAKITASYADIDGAAAVSDQIPLPPTREFARPLLGTVGPVTAEILKESDGRYAAGDEVGLSGLQARYEDTLAGTPGTVVQAVDTGSGRRRDLFRAKPQDGTPLRTTLDRRLQERAEAILADVDPASALVALRPSDGNVLAVASGPGSKGYSTATIGQYAPGSTFKVASSLALLRAGLTPASRVSCTRSLTVDGKSFENYDDYPSSALGDIPLRTAVANSCNTAFIHERGTVSQAGLADAAAALGLGIDHDLGFPAYLGAVPAEAPATEHAASMIGQGKILASPMAMAAVAASVGEGRTVVPRLLPQYATDDAPPDEPLTTAEGRPLRQLLRGVVTEGSGSFLADAPGPPVLAKTGTAEFGTSTPPQQHAWMIAVQGDLAVAAFVDVGESGSQTAGPLLEALLRAAR